jgi:hypothetical protein
MDSYSTSLSVIQKLHAWSLIIMQIKFPKFLIKCNWKGTWTAYVDLYEVFGFEEYIRKYSY